MTLRRRCRGAALLLLLLALAVHRGAAWPLLRRLKATADKENKAVTVSSSRSQFLQMPGRHLNRRGEWEDEQEWEDEEENESEGEDSSDDNGGGGGGGGSGAAVPGTESTGCRVGLRTAATRGYGTCLQYSVGGRTVQLAYNVATGPNGERLLDGAVLLQGNSGGGYLGLGVPRQQGSFDMIGASAVIARPVKGMPSGATVSDYYMPCTSMYCFTASTNFLYDRANTLKAVSDSGNTLATAFSILIPAQATSTLSLMFALGSVGSAGTMQRHYATGKTRISLTVAASEAAPDAPLLNPAAEGAAVLPSPSPPPPNPPPPKVVARRRPPPPKPSNKKSPPPPKVSIKKRPPPPAKKLKSPPPPKASNRRPPPPAAVGGKCSIGGVAYKTCSSVTAATIGAAATFYYLPTATTMKVAIKSATTGWIAWAPTTQGSMIGSDAIFVYPSGSGASYTTATMNGLTVGQFTSSWGQQTVGTPTATKLPTGELLLQFEIVWPGSDMMLFIGSGRYTGGSGRSGLQKHSQVPTFFMLTQAGDMQSF